MWIARNQDRTLMFFSKKPNKIGVQWIVDDNVYGFSCKLDPSLFSNLTWEDEPIKVNLFTNEFVQGFGDACYKQGEQDACRFEYGENPEGNLTIEEYVDSKNKTI